MVRLFLGAVAALGCAGTGEALACATTEEVMAHFETVKDAFIAKAPSMPPEQFTIWTGHLESFGDAMGKADFAGACAVLDLAAAELEFDVAPAFPVTTEAEGSEDATQESSDQESAAGARATIPKDPGASGTKVGAGGAVTDADAPDAAATPAETASDDSATAEVRAEDADEASPPDLSESQPPATGAAGPDTPPAWVECPRARCWIRDGY